MNGKKRLRILRPSSPDHFPLIELTAAAPGYVTDDDRVLVPSGMTEDDSALWAELLAAELRDRPYALRAIAGDSPWTHQLRLEVAEGVFRDFVVRCSGLPADELEARAHGFKSVEVEAWLGPDPELN